MTNKSAKMAYELDCELLPVRYFSKPYCTIDTPFEEMGFAKCHREFQDTEMFQVLCELQHLNKEKDHTINMLEKKIKRYEQVINEHRLWREIINDA